MHQFILDHLGPGPIPLPLMLTVWCAVPIATMFYIASGVGKVGK